MLTLQLIFAGLGPMLFHWGFGIGLMILCVVLAYFTTAVPLIGPWLGQARKDLLWAAFAIGVFMGGQALQAHDDAHRYAAQQKVVSKTVDKAVKKTGTVKYKQRKDRWDRSDY